MEGQPEFNRRITDIQLERHAQEVASVKTEVQGLRSDLSDVKEILRDLSASLTKMVVVEERQTRFGEALERAFRAVEQIDSRLRALEIAAPAASKSAAWIDRAIAAMVGALLLAVGKALHFF